jgi:glycosyltransferase involved in cell wall biosynthesis
MSRLLKSKGLIEFAHAAKTVKSLHPDVRFLLYGYPDDHEDSIAESEIKDSWLEKYGVEYMGFSKNPAAAIASSSIFVLLSYNEGTPRSVLEAMSMGRPIITTEARGCRETVNGKNGFLVPVGDHQQVSKRMIELLNSELRKKMGEESRKYCAKRFDVRLVNKSILAEVLNLNK